MSSITITAIREGDNAGAAPAPDGLGRVRGSIEGGIGVWFRGPDSPSHEVKASRTARRITRMPWPAAPRAHLAT